MDWFSSDSILDVAYTSYNNIIWSLCLREATKFTKQISTNIQLLKYLTKTFLVGLKKNLTFLGFCLHIRMLKFSKISKNC